MSDMCIRPRWIGWTSLLAVLLIGSRTEAQQGAVPFESDRWDLTNAGFRDHLGRRCVSGTAVLKDVTFTDGVIEVDLAVAGYRSYPGIVFRMESETNFEQVYVRPHRAGLYPDAVQYTPVINRVAGWQLYNGAGYTAAARIPANEWISLRLEVHGTQARVFLGATPEPVLEIHRLEHGRSSGRIGVSGPRDLTACFSNFRYRADDGLVFGEPPQEASPAGVIADWELSRVFKAERANRQQYPGFLTIFSMGWEPVRAAPSGLVDIARYRERTEGGADAVLARTVVRSDRTQDVTFRFGYSDEIDLFLNGRKVFAGNSAYQYRDPSFLGIVGYHDAVTLTLRKGLNEIFMYVTETFGGWGFEARIEGDVLPPVVDHARVTRAWATPSEFLTPESVLYDPDRRVLYVTSFDIQGQRSPGRTGYISKLGLDGTILEHKWVSELQGPTGMTLRGRTLYVVERESLTEIDVATGAVRARHPIPGAEFLNDVAVDADGALYVSDTRPSLQRDSRIYRFQDGRLEVWLEGDLVSRANALFVHDGELLIGNSGDGLLKAVDLRTKRIRDVVCLGGRIFDGIRIDPAGNYLVSHWEGQIYQVSPDGDVIQLLDLMPERLNTADFEYVPDRNLLVIPTFLGNQVVAYRLNTGTGNR